jgi:YD repeat-containing protein
VTSGSNISLAFSPNGGFVGYNAVTVNEKSTVSSSINSIVTHEFVNNQNIWRVDFPEMPFLNNGLPTRTTWKTNNGTVLKEELSTYQSLSDSVVYGYTVEDTAIGQAAECGNCGQAQYAKIGIGRFIFRAYAIRSKYYKLTSKVVNDYASTNILSTATDFTYNSQGLLRTESTTNSANDDLSKEYKYPVDYNPPTDPFPDTVVNNLKKKFFLVPVEEKQLFNGAVQKKTLNSFTYNSPAKYVTKTVSLKNSASTEIDFINYTTYSALTGNPIEYKGKNGVNTVILWGRNGTVPIAKIEGATLAQVNTQVNSTSIETMAPASLRTELLKLYYLTNCFVQVYVYDDKAQLIEIIDPTKTSTYFEYDAFGRFSLARDHNKNILANYQYHYIGQ